LIIDYEMKNNVDSTYIAEAWYTPEHSFLIIPRDVLNQTSKMRTARKVEMQDSNVHTRLQHDLMSERWEKWYSQNDEDVSMENNKWRETMNFDVVISGIYKRMDTSTMDS
jgi:hypothetical protein